jgi:uncharacterized delta-60 repeat protein
MKKLRLLIIFCLVVTQTFAQFSQPGELDTTFNFGSGTDGVVYATAIQPDGKIIIGGDFNSYNGVSRKGIARLHPDGSLDSTFNPGTGFEGVFLGIFSIVFQAEGKILVAGNFFSYNGIPRSSVARLNSNGSLDTSFNLQPALSSYNTVYCISIQADEKIIIGGDFYSYVERPRKGIVRLESNGNVDTTFSFHSFGQILITSTLLQEDGKIIIVGGFKSSPGANWGNVARLTSDGSLDSSFYNYGGLYSFSGKAYLQPDSKVLLTNVVSPTIHRGLIRLNSNGSVDTSFSCTVITQTPRFTASLALQTDDKIVIGGSIFIDSLNGWASLVRLQADGSLDTTFSWTTINPTTDPALWPWPVRSISIQQDGHIIVGGYFNFLNDTVKQSVVRVLGNSHAVGISDEYVDEPTLYLFPNPFIHQFQIVAPQPFHYQIFSIEGKAVNQGYLPTQETSICAAHWPSGTYILRIIIEEGVSVRKLVKE